MHRNVFERLGVKPPDGQVQCGELQKRKSLGLAGGPGEDRRPGHPRGSHNDRYPRSCLPAMGLRPAGYSLEHYLGNHAVPSYSKLKALMGVQPSGRSHR